MLSKEIFKQGMKDLVIFYPTWNVALMEKDAIQRWYEMFENIDENTFKKMIEEHIKTVKFNPTVASLLEIKSTIKFNNRYLEL